MIKMTPLMKELLDKALEDGTPCLIGTASKDGRPQISPKGRAFPRTSRKLFGGTGRQQSVEIAIRSSIWAECTQPGAEWIVTTSRHISGSPWRWQRSFTCYTSWLASLDTMPSWRSLGNRKRRLRHP